MTDLQIISNGEQMFLLLDDRCIEVVNPYISSVDYSISENVEPYYYLGDRNPRGYLKGRKSCSGAINFIGNDFIEREGHEITFTKEEKDLIKDYSISELFKLINDKINERD